MENSPGKNNNEPKKKICSVTSDAHSVLSIEALLFINLFISLSSSL